MPDAPTWRLLRHQPQSGARNMAIDEAILEAAGQTADPPTLRLYAWEPACLSLGYAQPASDADLDRLAELGWDIVRRPTGGRAILHTDELTYAVIGADAEPLLTGDILTVYQRLSQAILGALAPLQAEIDSLPLKDKQPNLLPAPICFETPTHFEIAYQGKKLVGSAQARRHQGVLQHGTLPLTGDLGRIGDVLAFETETERTDAAQRVANQATTLEQVVGRPVSWDEIADLFIAGFENQLGIRLQPGQLTPGESQRAEQLHAEKYAHPEWTHRTSQINV